MRKLRKPLSWLLAVCMLFSLLPGTALAADPGSTTADTSTLTSWQDVFGVGADQHLSTKDIGRIWTDKTVSTEDIGLSGDIGQDVTVSKEPDADFLVGLSALGSAATIVDKANVPVDTVFILDMSPKMGDPATVSDIAGVNARRVCMTAISCKAKKHTAGNPHKIWVFQLNCKNCGFCSFGGFFGVCGDIPQARWRRGNCLSPPPPSYSSMSCSST